MNDNRAKHRPAGRVLHVTTAADGRFALGAAVTIRSALERLPGDVRLVVHFLDNGLTASDRERLLASWREFSPEVHWYRMDGALLASLPLDRGISGHLAPSTYCRLFLGELLPPAVDRLIYLDADTLILRDLTALADEPLGEAWLGAAIEPSAPTVGSPLARIAAPGKVVGERRILPNHIPNHRDLGIPPETPYFNAGIFVTDLRIWREERLARRLLDCLHNHAEHVRCCDQYALNVVFHGRIRQIDPRWNRPANLDDFRYPEDSGLSAEAFEAAREHPWILHYAGREKPWLPDRRPPWTDPFLDTLDRTAWPRPAPPSPFAAWVNRRREKLGRLGRKLRRLLGLLSRAA